MGAKTAREPACRSMMQKSPLMEQGAEENNLGSIGSIGSDIKLCCFIHKNFSPYYALPFITKNRPTLHFRIEF